MTRQDVRLVELHGRQHTVVEFRHVTRDEAIGMVRAVHAHHAPGSPCYTGPRPHWVLIAAQVRAKKGQPWRWVGPETARAMGVFHKKTEQDYAASAAQTIAAKGA